MKSVRLLFQETILARGGWPETFAALVLFREDKNEHNTRETHISDHLTAYPSYFFKIYFKLCSSVTLGNIIKIRYFSGCGVFNSVLVGASAAVKTP